jgi:hypothetical protein
MFTILFKDMHISDILFTSNYSMNGLLSIHLYSVTELILKFDLPVEQVMYDLSVDV